MPRLARTPVIIPVDSAEPAAEPRSVLGLRSPDLGRLLLADDEPVSQRIAAAMLSSAGYRVDSARDGAEAIRAVTAQPYDAILMDCQMPKVDGYEATAAIRAREGPGRHTPIIGMTAGTHRVDHERCLAAGMDGYLAKPVSRDEILDRVALSLSSGTAVPGPPAGFSPPHWNGLASDAPDPALDPRIVERLERLGEATGEDLMAQLTGLFLADADIRVITLRDALATDDAAGVNRAAHTLSGASANLGAAVLARLCAALARHGGAGELRGGAALLVAVDAELTRVRSALGSLALSA
jgi:two-component system sensor histidine kinase/response regulator